jgi:Leucine-rich repeat (LRR) protein
MVKYGFLLGVLLGPLFSGCGRQNRPPADDFAQLRLLSRQIPPSQPRVHPQLTPVVADGRVYGITISDAVLDSIPPAIAGFRTLQDLSLVRCHLKTVGRVGNPAVTAISLADNELTSLPALATTFPGLTLVNLSRNRIARVENLTGIGPHVSYLDLSRNHMTSIRAEAVPKQLTRVDLACNELVTLEGPLVDCANALTLNLAYNKIEEGQFLAGSPCPKKYLFIKGIID